MTSTAPSVSVVIPSLNGSATIRELVKELEKLLSPLYKLEIVLVNDGSTDNTLDVCMETQKQSNCSVRVVDLSKNFGEHNAVMAGLHFATGEYAVIMDDDFQNPPSEVPKLIGEMQKGHDVVYTRYKKKKHAAWRNLGSWFNGSVARVMLGKPKGLYLSSFKAINAFVIKEILKYEGPYPYIDGLILRTTRRIGVINVEHEDRREGRSTYTPIKLIKLWLNMFTNFSIVPLRIATILGVICSFFGIVFGIVVVIERLQNPDLPIGWASLSFLIVMFSGVQLIVIGMIGEYVGRTFMFKNSSPQFIVRKEYSR
jgi:glycosyltransferase involved in cell wall biosynthesis